MYWGGSKKPSETWSLPVFPFDSRFNDFCYFYPCINAVIQNNYSGIVGGGFGGVDYDNGINVGLHKTEIPAISGSGNWVDGVYFIPENYKDNLSSLYSYQPTTIDDLWHWTTTEAGVYHCKTYGTDGRGTTGIFINGNLVAIIGNRQATDTETTVILNSGDTLNILNLTNVLKTTGEPATFNTLEEIKSKYPDTTLYQQCYNKGQGPVFIFSRFFPFKNNDNRLFGGTTLPNYNDGYELTASQAGVIFDDIKNGITKYTVQEDCWLSVITHYHKYNGSWGAVFVNGKQIVGFGYPNQTGQQHFFPVSKDDVVTVSGWIENTSIIDGIPTTETIQEGWFDKVWCFPIKDAVTEVDGFYDWSQAIILRVRTANQNETNYYDGNPWFIDWENDDGTNKISYTKRIDGKAAVTVHPPIHTTSTNKDTENWWIVTWLDHYIRKIDIHMRGQMFICDDNNVVGLYRNNEWHRIPVSTAKALRYF